jgi:hypothetical protein
VEQIALQQGNSKGTWQFEPLNFPLGEEMEFLLLELNIARCHASHQTRPHAYSRICELNSYVERVLGNNLPEDARVNVLQELQHVCRAAMSRKIAPL